MPIRLKGNEKALVVHKRIAQFCSVALIASLAGLVSCRSQLKNQKPVVDTRITCTTIQPLRYVKSDSKQTKEAIIAHNAVWDYYCLGDDND